MGVEMGNRKFESGAVRSSDADNERWDLISPIGLKRVAEAYSEGAKKYGEYNWEKGMPINDLLNHALRHIYLYLGGDNTEDHLAHAAWGLLASMHSEELWYELNKSFMEHRRNYSDMNNECNKVDMEEIRNIYCPQEVRNDSRDPEYYML